VLVGCDRTAEVAPTVTVGVERSGGATDRAAPPPTAPAFATLPAVDRFTYPDGADDVVAQVSIRVPVGPTVPILTVYGNGTVIAATNDGWRTGRLSDLDIQGLFDDADGIGLLDDELILRGPDTSAGPDIAISFDVNGRRLTHELDLSQIERPPTIRTFINSATVGNRFALTEVFVPESWIDCTTDGCEIGTSQRDASSRPVLPGESITDLLGG
jgi:hypothetical protein